MGLWASGGATPFSRAELLMGMPASSASYVGGGCHMSVLASYGMYTWAWQLSQGPLVSTVLVEWHPASLTWASGTHGNSGLLNELQVAGLSWLSSGQHMKSCYEEALPWRPSPACETLW